MLRTTQVVRRAVDCFIRFAGNMPVCRRFRRAGADKLHSFTKRSAAQLALKAAAAAAVTQNVR